MSSNSGHRTWGGHVEFWRMSAFKATPVKAKTESGHPGHHPIDTQNGYTGPDNVWEFIKDIYTIPLFYFISPIGAMSAVSGASKSNSHAGFRADIGFAGNVRRVRSHHLAGCAHA